MTLKKDDLHLTRLTAQGAVMPPVLQAGPLGVQPPPALSPQAASELYGGLSRFGFTGFQMIPGGAQIANSDGSSVLVLTGAGWQFAEDLSKSLFEHSVEKLDVAIREFHGKLPEQTVLMQQMVTIEAVWENLGKRSATEYIENRFLASRAMALADGLADGQAVAGNGLRLVISRPAQEQLPSGVTFMRPPGLPEQSGPVDMFDIRVETLLLDPSRLFLTVMGTYTATNDFTVVGRRAREVHNLLSERLAGNMTLEVR